MSITRVALLLFGSGFCGLLYQTAWIRELRLIFGMSTLATASVLAVYMGGLGLGGLLFGRRVDRSPQPLRLYGLLEVGVALSAVLTPLLVWLAREAYLGLGGAAALGPTGSTVLRLLLAAGVLAVPTLLMGGTLPAAIRAVQTEADQSRSRAAVLYGVNTLGAVAGSGCSVFFLLEVLGVARLLAVGAALNALVAVLALMLARRQQEAGVAASSVASPRPEPSTSPPTAPAPPETAAPAPLAFLLPAAALVGAAFFLLELVWYRMLAPLLGGTLYTFGLILTLALLGIGAGSATYAFLLRRRRTSLAGFALTCALEAAFVVVPLALGDRLALLAALLRPLGDVFGFAGLVGGWTVVAGIVVVPAAFLSGIQFPLLLGLVGRGRRDVGRQTGLVYAWNTAGAIAGSLAGGFGLMPLLGAPGLWRLVVLLLAVLAGIALALAWPARRSSRPDTASSLGALAAVTLALALLLAPGPTAAWRHAPIGAGRSRLEQVRGPEVEDRLRGIRRATSWETDGVESSLGLNRASSVALVINGKSDGNAVGDGGTQIMLALIPALLLPEVRHAAVVGLGTGTSAGWLGDVPGIERVDVIELEPAVRVVAAACHAVNRGALDNPKVRLIADDGRAVLLASREQYELIASEPSNPYRAGISSLFTREFYAAAASRLTPDGIFAQWAQAYEIDGLALQTIYATLLEVFPHVETWATTGGDLALLASRRPILHDVSRLRERLAQEPYRAALLAAWGVEGVEGLLAHHVAGPRTSRELARRADGWLNTDDQNALEFAFARNVGRGRPQLQGLAALARQLGDDLPPTQGPAYDRELLGRHRHGALALDRTQLPTPPPQDDAEKARLDALRLYATRSAQAAYLAWQKQTGAPRTLPELDLVAAGLAARGDEAAEPIIARLRELNPVMADVNLAILRYRQGRFADSSAALERCLRRYRVDPWAREASLLSLFSLAEELAGRSPEQARRIYWLLRFPFAASVMDDPRRRLLVDVARLADWPALCRDALAQLEPHVPWQQPLLEQRLDCYLRHGDPRAELAEEELRSFLAQQISVIAPADLPPAEPAEPPDDPPPVLAE
ncbi:MAG: fused MFS/spermidine synthase [Myxococcota bacterium]|jgi:spermidine synthase|nr:fused MFS/spermidine synthase [Myxococcota bacterium]